MKKFVVILLCLLSACLVYDPPGGILEINNTSGTAMYVYSTCEKVKLPCFPALKFDHKSIEPTETNKPDSYYPSYRMEANSIDSLVVGGSPDEPRIICKDKQMTMYFITEQIMREKSWQEICDNQLYQSKKTFSQEQLDRMDWKINYP